MVCIQAALQESLNTRVMTQKTSGLRAEPPSDSTASKQNSLLTIIKTVADTFVLCVRMSNNGLDMQTSGQLSLTFAIVKKVPNLKQDVAKFVNVAMC